MQHPAEQVKKQYTEYKKGESEIRLPPHRSNKNTREHFPGISFGTDLFIAAGGGS